MGKHKVLIELVVVLALVAWGLWSLGKNPASVYNNTGNTVTPTEDVTVGSINSGVKNVASISYAQALIKYKDARIQLDSNCQASPNKTTFKNGTNIMIDNRSSASRTVKIRSTFTIKPYGFKIVNLLSTYLPETLYVNCDASRNVSTILIQK